MKSKYNFESGSRRMRSALVVLGLGGALCWWWATQGPWHDQRQSSPSAAAEPRDSGPLGKRDYVGRLARQQSDAAARKLVVSYGAWAQEPGTEEARRDILDALFAIETFPQGLDSVLGAVAGDPRSPEADPLWNHAVDGLAMMAIEHHVRIADVRDRMLLEVRPRARRVLATALCRAALVDLTQLLSPDERHALSSDLIDVYFEPASEPFRSDLQGGIAALAGRDVGLLLRDGVEGVNWSQLETFSRSEHAVQQAMRELPKETR